MNFIQKPPLQHMAAVTVLSTLKIEDDIHYTEKDWIVCEPLSPEMRYEIKKMMFEKVTKLQLPKVIEGKIFYVFKIMLDAIMHWMSENIDEPTTAFKKHFLCWTPDGMIDYKKTTKLLIGDEELDICLRYNLACMYCLERDIPKFWYKLLEYKKELLIERSANDREFLDTSTLWALRMKMSTGNTIIPEMYSWQSVFECGINKETTEYALQKLTSEEREQSLIKTTERAVRVAWDEGKETILFFLLAQISEEQQMKIIQKFPCDILMNLLKWQRTIFFLETVEKLRNFLSLENYLELMSYIIYEAYRNDDCKELLREFWQEIPIPHKKFIFDKYESMMYESFGIKDEYMNKWTQKQTTDQYILILFESNELGLLESIFSECLSYAWEISELNNLHENE